MEHQHLSKVPPMKMSPYAWLAVMLTVGSMVMSQAVSAQTHFGAIAYSESSGAHGYAYDYDTRDDAE